MSTLAEVVNPTRAQVLTHSRLACLRACPRKEYLRYEIGLRPEVDSEYLRVGSAFALAIEADAQHLDVESALAEKIEDPYEAALVAAMYTAHRARWAEEDALEEHVAAELPFEIRLVNPDTGMPSRTFVLAGKIDRLRKTSALFLKEYKTTSRDFSPGAPYWLRLRLDAQLSIYLIAVRELGYDVRTIVYDVTRRPALRPRGVPLVDEAGSKIVHDSAGTRVRTKDGKKWRETGDAALGYVLQTRQETPEEYAARVTEAMLESPDEHFARVEIPRTDADLEECRREMWTQQLALREAQLSGRFFRNPEACVSATGQTCEFLPICDMRDLATRTPQGFRRVTDIHEELTASSGQAE